MPKEKVDFSALASYVPDGSFEPVLQYIIDYKVQLTITRSRTTVLGDYRHAHAGKNHRISVNGDLNKYAFLITLLHEIAHLITFEKHGNRVQPHGQEWKMLFGNLLVVFTQKNIFPDDVQHTLLRSISNPAASSCGDEKLLRVLKKYDERKEGIYFVEQIHEGEKFKIKGNRIFEKGERIRKRFKCREIATGKWYLFSPVSEVMKVA
jgi:predicted SprT family Zn-dependent metalloprotease